MANLKPGKHHEELRRRILRISAKFFLERGYTSTTLKSIASAANISSGSLTNLFATKEDILCALVEQVINSQFAVTGRLLNGVTQDKMLFYAAETVLQLHIVEMNENLRDVYCAAYSLPKPSALLQQTITAKLEDIFREHLPQLQTRDFYKLEIASGGIMRGFMTIPCDMWFTMDQKIASFLETTFLIYRVPDEKIREAIRFVQQFDFPAIAQATIAGILKMAGDEAP